MTTLGVHGSFQSSIALLVLELRPLVTEGESDSEPIHPNEILRAYLCTLACFSTRLTV